VANADGNSFHVNAVVVSGKTEALVIDSGFTRADALRVAANVLDSGKTLKTIFISNADPDFYFGADTDDAFAFIQRTGAGRSLLSGLDDATRGKALNALRDALQAHETADGVTFKSATWFISARKP